MPYFIARLHPAPTLHTPPAAPSTDGPIHLPFYRAASVGGPGYETRLEAEAVAQRTLVPADKPIILEAETAREAMQVLQALPLERPVPEADALLQALAARGVRPHLVRRLRIFQGAVQLLAVAQAAAQTLTLMEMDEEETARVRAAELQAQMAKAVSSVNARNSRPATHRGPSWYYQRGRLIAEYHDTDKRVLEALREILGPPLAETA